MSGKYQIFLFLYIEAFVAGCCRLLSLVSGVMKSFSLNLRRVCRQSWSVGQAQVDGNGLRALDHRVTDACPFPQ